MADYVCSFDLGTTGVKSGILNTKGDLIASAYREYGVISNEKNTVEQSIADMWNAQCETSKEVLANSGIKPDNIQAIGISSQRATFAPVDKNYAPLTNFIGWQDQRSIQQCDEMIKKIGVDKYYKIAGISIDPIAAVSKILWLKDEQPEIFEKTSTFASTQNVHLNMLGVENPPCDLASAAYLGLLDTDNLCWSLELLKLLDIPEDKMPSLALSGKIVGELSKTAADQLGFTKGTPIVTAGGDLQLAGIGMGVISPGFVSVVTGTGAGVLICLDKSLRHPSRSLNCLPHASSGNWEMEGISLAGGGAYKWLRNELGEYETQIANNTNQDPYDVLSKRAEGAPVGSHGLITLPMLLGAGSPNWNPEVRGLILNVNSQVTKPDIIRSCLEGICLEIKWIVEEAINSGAEIKEARLSGGGSKSPLWNQIASDIYGIPAATSVVGDAGLVGAGICAAVGVGLFSSIKEGAECMVQISQRYEPNLKNTEVYREIFEIFKDTYIALDNNNIYKRISKLA